MEDSLEIRAGGTKYLWKNGEIIFIEYIDGYQSWWLNDKRHREDGPALILENGSKEWWYKGSRIECSSQKEFERMLRLKAFW